MNCSASGWNFITTDEYCSSVRDGTHDSPKPVDQGYPLVTSRNIKGGLLDLTSANIISSLDYEEINRRSKVNQWDVLYSMIGTIGEVYLVEDEQPEFAIKNVGLFKCNSEEDGRWLSYWLRSPDAESYVCERLRGSTQQYIPLGELRKLPVPVPQNTDQRRRIISVIQDYDDLIDANRSRIALLEESARLLYREWFVKLRFPGHELVKVVDGVPEGWYWKTLDDVCDAVGGGTPSTSRPDYWGGDVVWVTPTDVTKNDCVVLLDSAKKITESGLANSSAKLLPAETILMSSRASIGFFALMDCPVCTNQGFISVIPKNDKTKMFLLFNLKFRVDEICSLATGTTFKEISKKTFRSLPVLWPISECLAEFEAEVYPLIQQTRLIKQQNKLLAQARDALLPKLMSGQLAV